MDLQERIIHLLETSGKSQSDLARFLGVSRATISDWKSGKIKSISSENAFKAGSFFNVNPEWLATGKGTKEGQAIRQTLPRPALPPGPEFVPVHYGSFRLQAGVNGFAVDYEDEEWEPLFFRESWLASQGLKAEHLTARKVHGDSMAPGLNHGDTVLIDTRQQEPIDGKVFAVNYEGELVIKRVIRDRGEWWLSSDNPDKTRYPNKVCTNELCFIIGQCVHKQSTWI